MNINFNRAGFPKDFQLGTSTSSYQIEGSSFGGCGASHWDTFAATPGNVIRGENGSRACEHYLHWSDDLDLIKLAGFDTYRFSTSWARVMPEGTGIINHAALDFYDRLVDGLLERQINPVAMLYHWDLPAALSDRGGWSNPDIASWFADYTQIVMKRIGDRLHGVATINEPWCIAWLSHYLGVHAPGIRNIRSAVRAMHFVLCAHAKSLAVMRSLGIDNIGIALNFEYPQADDDSENSLKAARLYDGIYNRWFAQALTKGSYPEDVLAVFEPYMPEGYQANLASINMPIDWMGINYYTRKLIGAGKSGAPTDFEESVGDLDQTTMGWEIYPTGLEYFLYRLHRDYTGSLPLIVTENGMSSNDVLKDGVINDVERIKFLNLHLEQVKRAIKKGAPVKGYYIWSLMDNFEWTLGYEKRFGLVHVDFETMKRTPKNSFYAFATALNK